MTDSKNLTTKKTMKQKTKKEFKKLAKEIIKNLEPLKDIKELNFKVISKNKIKK